MDSKERFSSRVDNYVKYRPGYPFEILEPLRKDCGLTSQSIIADIGSGTGLLAMPFLSLGCRVIGIEPNTEMRAAGDTLLSAFPKFSSQVGSAEATGLPDESVNFITAGQAFHWFDRDKAREEFRRILRSPRWVVLVWNDRRVDTTPFLREYEKVLLDYGTDYTQINHRNINDAVIQQFFGSGSLFNKVYDNVQWFDFDGLRGRLLSSSYVPEQGQPGFDPMLTDLKRIFDKNQSGGKVAVEYDTRVYYGQV